MSSGNIEVEIDAAIKAGDLKQVKRLIGSDLNRLNMMTVFGSWLHVAAEAGKIDIMEYLLAMGIDINVTGGLAGGTALNEAANEGRVEAVRYLIGQGAFLNFEQPERNPLFGAIVGGHTEIAKLLIEAGIDTKVKYTISPTRELTALFKARERGRNEIVAMLSDGEPAPFVPSEEEPHAEIISQMARHFGPVEVLGLNEILPVTGVRINFIPARSPAEPVILFTTGMSDFPNNVPKGMEAYRFTELFIRLPSDWPIDKRILKPKYYWPIEWLKKLAHYPKAENGWIGDRVTIMSNGEPPEPLAPNSKMTCMLLAREPKGLNPVTMKDGRQVLLYSLLPLYTEERDLERDKGTAALFAKFDKHDVSMVVDLNRENTALI